MQCNIHTINDQIHVVTNGNGGWCQSNLVYFGGVLVDTGPDPVIAGSNIGAFKYALSDAFRVKTVVITHPDVDHVGGLKLFADAKVVAAADAVPALDALNPRLMATLVGTSFLFPSSGPQFKEAMGKFDLRGIVVRRPDETFQSEKIITTDSGEIKLKTFSRCHSPSDTIAVLPGGVVAAGDLLFHRVTPVIWGNPDNWIKAIDFILTLKPASLIPGHGGLMTVADAAQLRDYFLFLRERSAQCHGKGLPVADAVKAVAAELPGRFRSLLLPERLAVNVEACYAAIDKTPAPGDYPAFKRFRLFGKMRKARGNFG